MEAKSVVHMERGPGRTPGRCGRSSHPGPQGSRRPWVAAPPARVGAAPRSGVGDGRALRCGRCRPDRRPGTRGFLTGRLRRGPRPLLRAGVAFSRHFQPVRRHARRGSTPCGAPGCRGRDEWCRHCARFRWPTRSHRLRLRWRYASGLPTLGSTVVRGGARSQRIAPRTCRRGADPPRVPIYHNRAQRGRGAGPRGAASADPRTTS